MQTAENAVEDNLHDYLAQLKDCTKDSFLEELDDFNVEVIYKRLAVNSVAFMLMSRCGLDTGEYFETEDFSDITNFNTPATITPSGLPQAIFPKWHSEKSPRLSEMCKSQRKAETAPLHSLP